MTTPPTVWITRTTPGAEATAERVRTIGMTPFVASLLEVVFEGGGEIDLTGVEALAFTSANGVRAFAARTTQRSLPVFAVGRGTARAASDVGFTTVTASDNDVLALARAIPVGSLIVHAGAREQAADLVLALESRGVRARGIVVYRTVVATLSDEELATAGASDFVLLQSAKAARAFRGLGLARPRPVCLSESVNSALSCGAEEMRAGGRRSGIVAPAATEDALIAALVQATR